MGLLTTRTLGLSLFALALTSIPACYGARVEDAKNALPKSLFCPEDRIEARAREDLQLVQFACLAQAAFEAVDEKERRQRFFGFDYSSAVRELKCGKPPPEIMENPGRLRVWLELREKEFRRVDQGEDTIFEVKACGAHHFYNCVGRVTNGCLRAPANCTDLGDTDPRAVRLPLDIPLPDGGA